MFLGVYLPPKFLAEVFCGSAHFLEVIEIRSRDAFKDTPHACHGDRRQAVLLSRVVKVAAKKAHQLTALGFATFFGDECCLDLTDRFHGVVSASR